ncbi:MAG TPA: hypothetical protein VKJ45_21110 [Blastocatellia bacterium]|nr:hypothetical protein [Blastocatellia bacterium]
MNINAYRLAAASLMGLGLLSCGQVSSTSAPTTPVASIAIGSDLSKIDVCHAIPKEDIEAVMGRKLVKTQPFAYYETAGSGGCWYEAAKDKDGEAHFGYVAFTPVAAYNEQPLYKKTDVGGLGVAAYYNNGADARQLWVKINDRVAMVVAFGDVPKEAGARSLAELVLAATK